MRQSTNHWSFRLVRAMFAPVAFVLSGAADKQTVEVEASPYKMATPEVLYTKNAKGRYVPATSHDQPLFVRTMKGKRVIYVAR